MWQGRKMREEEREKQEYKKKKNMLERRIAILE